MSTANTSQPKSQAQELALSLLPRAKHGLPEYSIEAAVEWFERICNGKSTLYFALYFLLIMTVDFVTGDENVLAMLYLPVICFVTVRINLTAALYVSLICAIIWLVDDILIESVTRPTQSEYLSAAIHFICFVVIATLLFRLTIALKREKLFSRSDFLTGLPNMLEFNNQSSKLLVDQKLGEQATAITFIDCDNFKTVNDTLGHQTGDELLKVVGEVLNASVRDNDCVARYGGDEFVILLTQTSEAKAIEILNRTKASLDRAMQTQQWPVTFSIGIAVFPQSLHSIEYGIRKADELMYGCKQLAKDGISTKVFVA